jgi:hypothetical protein
MKESRQWFDVFYADFNRAVPTDWLLNVAFKERIMIQDIIKAFSPDGKQCYRFCLSCMAKPLPWRNNGSSWSA